MGGEREREPERGAVAEVGRTTKFIYMRRRRGGQVHPFPFSVFHYQCARLASQARVAMAALCATSTTAAGRSRMMRGRLVAAAAAFHGSSKTSRTSPPTGATAPLLAASPRAAGARPWLLPPPLRASVRCYAQPRSKLPSRSVDVKCVACDTICYKYRKAGPFESALHQTTFSAQLKPFFCWVSYHVASQPHTSRRSCRFSV